MFSDRHFMERALKLAGETVALASPNPQVGCVLVRKNIVIGEGAHQYEGRDHAEIVALKQAAERGVSAEGATAYVTLEPCSHHGRTPPCADALIAARIGRAVVATVDPNPRVSGEGIRRLRQAGVEVSVGTCEQQARDMNDAFAHFIQTGRPFVTLKNAISADGKIAPPPARRFPNQPYWLTGVAARYEVQLLRHASDAILTGVGTVLADDPALTDRTELPRRRGLLRVILDTHLRTPADSQLVRSARGDLLVLCGKGARTVDIAALEDVGAEVHVVPQHAGRLSLAATLDLLAERGCISLLLECGSHLNGAFLNQRLVDRVVLFRAEQILGDGAVPFALGYGPPELLEQELQRQRRDVLGPETVVEGYLRDPWRTVTEKMSFGPMRP